MASTASPERKEEFRTAAHVSAAASASSIRRVRSATARILDQLSPLLVAIGVVAIWEFGAAYFGIKSYILPRPSEIVEWSFENWTVLLPATKTTALEMVIGFFGGAVLAVVLGVIFSAANVLERLFMPLIVATQAVPKIALAPVLLIWFGIGIQSKIILVVISVFFPIFINTVTGMRAVDRSLVEMFSSVGATKLQIIFKLRFPYALSYIFAGLKIATSLSVIAAIVSEWVNADQGLGYLILTAGAQFEMIPVFAALVMMVILSLVFYGLAALAERLWARRM